MRRAPGKANVEEHPKGTGKYRVRVRVYGKLRTLGTQLPEAEAREIADAYGRGEPALAPERLTLKLFGPGFLDRRERAGIRNVRTDRTNWKNHVAADPIADIPLAELHRRDVLDWRDRLSGSRQTRKNLLSLLRVALEEALDRGLCQSNPAREVRVGRGRDADREDDLDGILSLDEQRRLLEAVPEAYRALVVFALLTGLRQAEQWWLKPEDLGEGKLVVRRSVRGLPPKNGRNRTVHLLEPARRALELAPKGAWVWPALRGGRRQQGKAPKSWPAWVRAAGIARRVRWHDLRHTCATALLAGWWGRKWTLDEVCMHLGHSSVKVTERYARKPR